MISPFFLYSFRWQKMRRKKNNVLSYEKWYVVRNKFKEMYESTCSLIKNTGSWKWNEEKILKVNTTSFFTFVSYQIVFLVLYWPLLYFIFHTYFSLQFLRIKLWNDKEIARFVPCLHFICSPFFLFAFFLFVSSCIPKRKCWEFI